MGGGGQKEATTLQKLSVAENLPVFTNLLNGKQQRRTHQE